MRVRQYFFMFLFFLLINIIIRVFLSIYITNDIKKKRKGSGKYGYGRTVAINIARNKKTLLDLLICNTQNLKDDLRNEENLNVYTNTSNFLFQYYFDSDKEKESLKTCPLKAPNLGPVTDDQSIWSLLGIDDMYLWIQPGGFYVPTECLARQQAAIIIAVHVTFRLKYKHHSGIHGNEIKPCPVIPPHLGPVAKDKQIWSLFRIDSIYLRTEPGGIHFPKCFALQHAAIIIPIHETLRPKSHYIASFLYYIHPFLMKQQLEYQIFVIVKPPVNVTTPFKRGRLFNIGFKEAQTYRPGGWGCIIFHDAHLVPLDTRNLYRCSKQPKMLKSNSQKPYKFGGAVAIRPRQFMRANGFSNRAWSNDGDYIDMYKRLHLVNFTVETSTGSIGNYSYFEELRQENQEFEKNQTNRLHYLSDGLTTLSYTIKNSIRLQQFYTLIEINN